MLSAARQPSPSPRFIQDRFFTATPFSPTSRVPPKVRLCLWRNNTPRTGNALQPSSPPTRGCPSSGIRVPASAPVRSSNRAPFRQVPPPPPSIFAFEGKLNAKAVWSLLLPHFPAWHRSFGRCHQMGQQKSPTREVPAVSHRQFPSYKNLGRINST